MGLPVPSMRLILREHVKRPFQGRILCLGRMGVMATHQRLLKLFKEEGVTPKELDSGLDTLTNIPQLRDNPGKRSQFTNDVVFFKHLGVDTIETLDVSDYETADHILDMNHPVPEDLHSRFDAIFDFGTSEHIFDTRQVLDNVSRMLKPDGRVLHLVPATNRIGHGYHMFSPILFYDYYWANKFTDCQAYLTESGRAEASYIKWKLFKYDYDSNSDPTRWFMSRSAVGVFFTAWKTADSTFGTVPNQGQFSHRYPPAEIKPRPVTTLRKIRRRAPRFLKEYYARFRATVNKKRGNLEYLGKI